VHIFLFVKEDCHENSNISGLKIVIFCWFGFNSLEYFMKISGISM